MITRVGLGVGAAVLLTAALTPAAHAETTYRYWSYWIGGESWTYSARGAGFRVPPEAGVEGYRFTVSPKDGSQAAPPATASSYEALCPGQPAAPEGQKRVAVVLDFGPAGIAPVGEAPPATTVQCVTAPVAATGLQVLQQVAQLRFHSSGLICGISGFPATECPGQSAATATRPASLSPTPTASTARPVLPSPAPTRAAASITPSVSTSATASPSPTPTPTVSPVIAATAVALGSQTSPPADQQPATPAWIAAIGAGMIAALLGLALLARKGRE